MLRKNRIDPNQCPVIYISLGDWAYWDIAKLKQEVLNKNRKGNPEIQHFASHTRQSTG
jgi:hypothetical protein